MKRIILSAMIWILALYMPMAQSQTQFISILTSSQAGTWYPIGVSMAQVLNRDIPGIRATAQPTRGSVENLQLIKARRGEIAFSLADTLSLAWQGDAEAGFPEPIPQMRALTAIHPNYIQIVASADSGIRSLNDLKGKRVSVGAARSGTELNARAIFRAAGLSYKDLAKTEYLPFQESVDLIKNRQLDATLMSAGLGALSIRDLAQNVNIVIVPIPKSIIDRIGNPAYHPAVIPANTYLGQTQDVPTALIPSVLVTHDQISDDMAYAMVKTLYANLNTIQSAHSAAKDIDLKNALRGLPIPLHPGAAKFYKEKGLLK